LAEQPLALVVVLGFRFQKRPFKNREAEKSFETEIGACRSPKMVK
jgi:hypothetical protein